VRTSVRAEHLLAIRRAAGRRVDRDHLDGVVRQPRRDFFGGVVVVVEQVVVLLAQELQEVVVVILKIEAPKVARRLEFLQREAAGDLARPEPRILRVEVAERVLDVALEAFGGEDVGLNVGLARAVLRQRQHLIAGGRAPA
jgi:hypothetical protein